MSASEVAPAAPEVAVSSSSLRLYCLPYAGSSASVYVRWKRRLPAWIEVIPIELPGRGRRLSEPLETSVSAVLDRIVDGVRPAPGQAFAIFGHSLGAVLAFELAHRLESGGLSPAVVFVSGTRAPGSRDLERYARVQSDAELRAELERLGGTPASVLADPELMALALPVLRADFRVAGSYQCPPGRRIQAPLHVVAGLEDTTTPETLNAWREHTRGEFELSMLPGGHFFLQTREAELLQLVEQTLRRRLTELERSERAPHPVALPGRASPVAPSVVSARAAGPALAGSE